MNEINQENCEHKETYTGPYGNHPLGYCLQIVCKKCHKQLKVETIINKIVVMHRDKISYPHFLFRIAWMYLFRHSSLYQYAWYRKYMERLENTK